MVQVVVAVVIIVWVMVVVSSMLVGSFRRWSQSIRWSLVMVTSSMLVGSSGWRSPSSPSSGWWCRIIDSGGVGCPSGGHRHRLGGGVTSLMVIVWVVQVGVIVIVVWVAMSPLLPSSGWWCRIIDIGRLTSSPSSEWWCGLSRWRSPSSSGW